ncbi:hypothetical protein CYMTET_45153 [Cymbomonas tetramitiformis]|uniref:Uncharacterized protein n=1 Tax=Cymbomonas tetramitiformis TaxID=36881 RepID=A0AAE0BZZ9_9CHLO|nr:hypothetical protein CYMTET_45153 [Cymbomonas tetramitiformis]
MPQGPPLRPVRGAGEAGAQRPFLDTRNFAIETGALFSNICLLLFGCTFYVSAVHADEAYGYNFYFEPITFMFIVGTQSAFAWIVFNDFRDVSGAASAKARPARLAGARRNGGPPQLPLRRGAGWPSAPLADAADTEVAGSLGGQRATRKRPPFRTPGAEQRLKVSICEDEVGCAGHGSRKTSDVKSRAGQAETVLKTFIREDTEKVGSAEYGGVDYAGWRIHMGEESTASAEGCGMSASWRMSRLMQKWVRQHQLGKKFFGDSTEISGLGKVVVARKAELVTAGLATDDGAQRQRPERSGDDKGTEGSGGGETETGVRRGNGLEAESDGGCKIGFGGCSGDDLGTEGGGESEETEVAEAMGGSELEVGGGGGGRGKIEGRWDRWGGAKSSGGCGLEEEGSGNSKLMLKGGGSSEAETEDGGDGSCQVVAGGAGSGEVGPASSRGSEMEGGSSNVEAEAMGVARRRWPEVETVRERQRPAGGTWWRWRLAGAARRRRMAVEATGRRWRVAEMVSEGQGRKDLHMGGNVEENAEGGVEEGGRRAGIAAENLFLGGSQTSSQRGSGGGEGGRSRERGWARGGVGKRWLGWRRLQR